MTATLAPVWFTARAAGIGALFGASLTVAFGILMAARVKVPGLGRIELRALHEAVALGTLALIAVHGVALMADPVLKAGVGGVLVPFTSPWEPVGVALGQIAAYGIAGLSLTYYARKLLGPKRWQKAHRAIPVFWALGLLHGVIVGTDARTWWMLAVIVPPALAAWVLLLRRWFPETPDERPAREATVRPRPELNPRDDVHPAGTLWR
jgi:sulfoxide reductase heme-binding subunit YedZ